MAAIALINLISGEINYSKRLKEEMKKYRDNSYYDRKGYANQVLGGSNFTIHFCISVVFFLWGIFYLP